MKIQFETKINSEERLKDVGERLTHKIISSGFNGDIEVIALLQELLSSTGADPVKIQKEIHRLARKRFRCRSKGHVFNATLKPSVCPKCREEQGGDCGGVWLSRFDEITD